MWGQIFTPDPVNHDHPLNQGRTNWWLGLPGLAGGRQFFDLMGLNHGILRNNPLWGGTTRPGGFNQLVFDGVSNYLDCGQVGNYTTEDFTIAFWFNPLFYYGNMVIAYKGPYPSYGYYIQAQGGTIIIVTCYGGISITNTLLPPTNMWTQLVFVRQGAFIKIYQNGIDATYSAQGLGNPISSPDPLIFGAYIGPQLFAPCSMDDIQLYNRALSAGEVRALYDESCQGYPNALNRLTSRIISLPAPSPIYSPASLLMFM